MKELLGISALLIHKALTQPHISGTSQRKQQVLNRSQQDLNYLQSKADSTRVNLFPPDWLWHATHLHFKTEQEEQEKGCKGRMRNVIYRTAPSPLPNKI